MMQTVRRFCLAVALLALIPRASMGEESEDLQWLLPPPEIQRDMDPTLVPVGRGAIFVPAMSDPRMEPPYTVYQGKAEVGTAPVGTRVIVKPGTYEVELGSGSGQDRLRRSITVIEGRTAILKPDWAGLRVQVVDENLVPIRSQYELIEFPTLHNLGIGFGAQLEQGEEIRTWILEPGLYMLLKPGESYQARTNFFTFRTRPGHLEQITLVVNPDSGDFLGAGEVNVLGPGSTEGNKWVLSAVVGGALSLIMQRNLTGAADTTTLGPSFYVDGVAQYNGDEHLGYGRLSIDEAFTQEDWARFEKNTDFFRMDVLYAYRILPIFGPYVRLGMESRLFPGFEYFDEKKDVVLKDGDTEVRRFEGKEEFQLSPPFMPLTLKGGIGLRVSTPPSTWIDLWALAGFGGRYTFANNMYTKQDVSDTPEIEVGRLSSFWSYGLESTVVARANLSRWVVLNTEFEIFVPVEEFNRPTLRWDSNLGLRITSFISVNYIYRMLYEPDINEELQHDHQALLRFSYKFL